MLIKKNPNLVGDRGKTKKLRKKGKYPLTFEIKISRNNKISSHLR